MRQEHSWAEKDQAIPGCPVELLDMQEGANWCTKLRLSGCPPQPQQRREKLLASFPNTHGFYHFCPHSVGLEPTGGNIQLTFCFKPTQGPVHPFPAYSRPTLFRTAETVHGSCPTDSPQYSWGPESFKPSVLTMRHADRARAAVLHAAALPAHDLCSRFAKA